MSLLDQAKREAKRLYKLAQSQSAVNNIHHLPFSSLSQSKEYIANINGYDKWHDYEENLKRKDTTYGLKDKVKIQNEEQEILLNKEYFIQDIPFKTYQKKSTYVDKIYHYQEATPINIGNTIADNSLSSNKESQTVKLQYYSYPMVISGSTGAGKTETLITMVKQFIDNKEGCIYVDAKGDSSIFYKFFSFAQQAKRQNDLYVLNFMYGSAPEKGADNKPIKKLSNSFDPINPLIGTNNIFIDLFGKEFGMVFQQISMVAKSKNWLINIDNIEAMCMLPNLINWSKNGYWNNATSFITTYLNNIGYTENCDESDFEDLIEQHALNCQKIKSIIDRMKPYYEYDIFSITPEIDMESIFKDRKILLILQPCLERSLDIMGELANLINQQILYFSQQNNTPQVNNHWQNIIIDDFFYSLNDQCNDQLIKSLSNKEHNWIFATEDFYYYNKIFNTVITQSQTFVIMKSSHRNLNLPAHLKILIFDNIDNVPPIFSKNIKTKHSYYIPFDEQREGMAYILTPNTGDKDRQKWTLERINCEYSPAVMPKQLFLNRFSSHVTLK